MQVASRPTDTFTDQATGNSIMVSATPALIGPTLTWFGGRVYNPMATWNNSNGISLIFDGYDAAYAARALPRILRTIAALARSFCPPAA